MNFFSSTGVSRVDARHLVSFPEGSVTLPRGHKLDGETQSACQRGAQDGLFPGMQTLVFQLFPPLSGNDETGRIDLGRLRKV